MSITRKSAQRLLAITALLTLTLSPLGAQQAAAQAGTLAVTWYVATTGDDGNSCQAPDAPCATINGAIAKAAGGDTIKIAIGTYMGSGTEVVRVNKGLTLSGGWDAGFTAQTGLSTIDGEAARRGMFVTQGVTVSANHLLVQNGYHTAQGGGIYSKGKLTLSRSTVSGNVSDWMGGGIYSEGVLTVNSSTISGNTGGDPCCSGGGGGAGISVHSPGKLTVNQSTISGNTILGGFGGSAIEAQTSTVTLNNSTLSGNTGAGAIALFNGNTTSGMTLTLNNSTVSGNAGGIGNTYAAVILNNSTVAYNTPSVGIANDDTLPSVGTFTLRNSIVAKNGIPGGTADCQGHIASLGYNLVGENTGCTFTTSTGDQVGTAAVPLDPRLDILQDNGGQTDTQALLPDSPALNAGNPAVPGSGGNTCKLKDQRGVARTIGRCDIGAYEAQFPVVQSITRANANPTSASTVHFTVTFSQAVTGVDMTDPFDDFSLTSTGTLVPSITSVSGSGSTYTVTVNVGTDIGTVRLDLVDRDTILNGASVPLGGVGLNNADYSAGAVYTIKGPFVKTITAANTNPTRATSVGFIVKFSEPVTGVDLLTPFPDFALTTTGVTGAFIASITGTGAKYTVTVKTGSGNGTIRLDVADDNTIVDAAGRLLGGDALGDGNFTTGVVYTVSKIPTPQSPSVETWDTTPRYTWLKVPGATQYRYQLYRGTTLVYTRTVGTVGCASVFCSDTPTTQLAPGADKWRVQALIGGAWKAYTPFKSFTLYAPKAGYWWAQTDGIDFYVTPSRTQVDNFSVYVHIDGCGDYQIMNTRPVSINNLGSFGFVNKFSGSGIFSKTSTSPASASGTASLDLYYIDGCGPVNGGPYNWNAVWKNTTQPASALGIDDVMQAIVVPMLDAPPGFSIVKAIRVTDPAMPEP